MTSPTSDATAPTTTEPTATEPTATARARGRSRGARIATRVVAVLGGAAVLGGIAMAVVAFSQPATATTVDMRGNAVQLDPGVAPIPIASSHAKPDIGGRLIVKSVGLNVPLGALNAVHGQITPPGFASAYWVRNKGVPASSSASGTTFVVMHSLRNGGIAPGNYVTDVEHERSAVADGASVLVAGVGYTVTGSRLIPKGNISDDAAVWADTPNRLLLITCLEHPDGSASTDNLVITAERAPAR